MDNSTSRWPLRLSLVLLTAGCWLARCGATAGIGPSQLTCTQFLKDLQAGHKPKAYSLLTAACRATVTPQQLSNYWDLVEKNRGKVQSWSQQGVSFYSGTGGSTVQLGYRLQCASGQSAVGITCVPESGQWRIQAFQFQG